MRPRISVQYQGAKLNQLAKRALSRITTTAAGIITAKRKKLPRTPVNAPAARVLGLLDGNPPLRLRDQNRTHHDEDEQAHEDEDLAHVDRLGRVGRGAEIRLLAEQCNGHACDSETTRTDLENAKIKDAIARMDDLRKGVRLDGLKIKDLINEGRKY